MGDPTLGEEQLRRGREALLDVGANKHLVRNAPAGVVRLVGAGETLDKRLDRARCLLRTRRQIQRKLAVRSRWKMLHSGDPFGSGELDLDLFVERDQSTGG